MPIIISDAVLLKLSTKHTVTENEVRQCFENREGGLLIDNRENHKTDPPTMWFVAPTNRNRFLKIIFVVDGLDIYIKSAYEASDEIKRIYKKFA